MKQIKERKEGVYDLDGKCINCGIFHPCNSRKAFHNYLKKIGKTIGGLYGS